MSQLGQKATFPCLWRISALPPKADIGCLRVRALEAAIAMGRASRDGQLIRLQLGSCWSVICFFRASSAFVPAREKPR
jgi:hypothetical protein